MTAQTWLGVAGFVAMLSKLLENKSVARYLRQHQPGVLVEFEAIVQTVSLDN